MLQGTGETKQRARKLRREMSLPEILLWRLLRQRPLGVKFRRQHPSGPYIADFYCHEARLIIEIDGAAHDCGDRPERDVEGNAWFKARRLTIIRIPAAEVLRDPDAVADSLARRALPLHHPAGGPPPHPADGEELRRLP